jgi:hypothetical protein
VVFVGWVLGAVWGCFAEHKYDVGKINAVMLREMGIGLRSARSHAGYRRGLAVVR